MEVEQFLSALSPKVSKVSEVSECKNKIYNSYSMTTFAYYTYFSGKPYPPVQVLVHCGHGEGSVTWQSSYFGYEQQYSIVQFSTDNVNFVNGTRVTTENIKQEIYQTRVYNLQYGTHYFLRVLTINAHGFSTSSVKNCSIGAQEGVYLASLLILLSLTDEQFEFLTSNIYFLKINIDLNFGDSVLVLEIMYIA